MSIAGHQKIDQSFDLHCNLLVSSAARLITVPID